LSPRHQARVALARCERVGLFILTLIVRLVWPFARRAVVPASGRRSRQAHLFSVPEKHIA
jgi:hypothetical protein